MIRRDIFSTVLAGGAALVLAGTPARAAPRAAANPVWVTAADGTRLYVRIWGAGAPILFLSGWALSSE
ncbi:MAG: hypothetical protein Q8Q79_02625, partial [Sphingopyxis sp.]|nr:hypothetical protein [Sphingopyxis sp.]